MRNLQGLVSFVETASCGSFTAAAAKLDITPAAVGKNVMRLEQELGVRLFNRTTRRLHLTAEGEALLGEASGALQRLDDAIDGVSNASQEASGRVRISVGIAFGRRFVLPLLPALTRRHPKLVVEVDLDNRRVDPVAEGYDLCVRGGLADDSALVALRLCGLASVLVASPAYLRRHGVPGSHADLGEHAVLGLRFASGRSYPWRFHTGDGPVEWTPTARVWSSDPDSFLPLATAGHGICQAGLLHAAPYLRRGSLKLVLHDTFDHENRQMLLCYPSRKLVSRRVRVVIDELAGALRAEPDLQLAVQDVPADWRARPQA